MPSEYLRIPGFRLSVAEGSQIFSLTGEIPPSWLIASQLALSQGVPVAASPTRSAKLRSTYGRRYHAEPGPAMSWWGRNFGGVDATEVVPGLRMGAAPSRRAARGLARAGVTHAIDLRGRGDAVGVTVWPEEVFTHSYPLEEYEAPDIVELRQVSSDVASLIAQGEVVYVHCRAGIQRAPTVACAVLMQLGWSLADAYRVVSSRRAVAAMSAGQLAVLRQFDHLIDRPPTVKGPTT